MISKMTEQTLPRPKFVAYYRVSTDKQGRSGLGLEAQSATVESHARRNGGEIIAQFQEIESGKRADRPELLKALELCRRKKAVLIIAKLDRLSRNVAFIANLMESRVEFIACDMPEANKLTLHIMAAMAQHEREATSKRTKEALAIVKARGTKLGRPNADIKEVQRHWSEQARAVRERIYPTAQSMRQQGMTLTQIAQRLNDQGLKTCRNGVWYASTVGQLLKNQTEAAA
jgi:DNA invertase Pin-like site-specific DNA recombinase